MPLRSCAPLRIVDKPALPPMLGIVGFSGSGKTTLTVVLIAALTRRGLRVATIKHDSHGFEMDRPGKDTWRHKQAGAAATLISSPRGIGLVRDADHDHRPEELLPLLGPADIVLVEGFKRASLPKIEVFRPELGKPPACRGDLHLRAVVSDAQLDWGVPRFAPGEVERLCAFILAELNLASCSCAPGENACPEARGAPTTVVDNRLQRGETPVTADLIGSITYQRQNGAADAQLTRGHVS